MSYFGTALRAKIEGREMVFADVAAVANISPGFISQICTGRQETVTKATVEAILDAFKIEDAIELAIAHLQDELPKQAQHHVQIVAADPRETIRNYFVKRLDNTFESAVDRIRAAVPHNEDLRLLVIDLANATCGRSQPQLIAAEKPTSPTSKEEPKVVEQYPRPVKKLRAGKKN
jgi:transcriptional regulator with XRE-family HTH domain